MNWHTPTDSCRRSNVCHHQPLSKLDSLPVLAGLNLPRLTKLPPLELDLSYDAQQMTSQLRLGIVENLKSSLQARLGRDEPYPTAGFKGQPGTGAKKGAARSFS